MAEVSVCSDQGNVTHVDTVCPQATMPPALPNTGPAVKRNSSSTVVAHGARRAWWSTLLRCQCPGAMPGACNRSVVIEEKLPGRGHMAGMASSIFVVVDPALANHSTRGRGDANTVEIGGWCMAKGWHGRGKLRFKTNNRKPLTSSARSPTTPPAAPNTSCLLTSLPMAHCRVWWSMVRRWCFAVDAQA
jgi:hypothetical protein